jgi:hypothetical protein
MGRPQIAYRAQTLNACGAALLKVSTRSKTTFSEAKEAVLVENIAVKVGTMIFVTSPTVSVVSV